MSRRYSVYLALIVLLLAVNLGRWWFPSETGRERVSTRGGIFLPDDFRLRIGPTVAGKPSRNLFRPEDNRIRAATFQPGILKTRVLTQAPVPVQREQAEADPVGAEIGKLKLLGVVFRAGKGQAYLTMNKESVIVFAGDRVLGQFVVEKVDVDAVELRDLRSNTTRRIPVSGK